MAFLFVSRWLSSFLVAIRLISSETIALTAYLRSWALIIISRFLLDFCLFLLDFFLFLLEVIGASSLGPLLF